ncbi:hypothetical protein CEP82_011980 [Mobiluncus mulieris]|nr:hypothetical protein CEP82_011980 [Mobiluncus mulieris]
MSQCSRLAQSPATRARRNCGKRFSTVIVANHDLRRIMSRFWRFGHSWGIFRGLPKWEIL